MSKAKSRTLLGLYAPAFPDDGPIPKWFTEDGRDVSPALEWSIVPDGTQEYVLVVDDPDAPSAEPWVHWLIYAIPPDTRRLPEGAPPRDEVDDPPGALQGLNSWGTIGYRGPAPPRGDGPHHYRFTLFALDTPTDLEPGADRDELQHAINGHILAQETLTGTYER